MGRGKGLGEGKGSAWELSENVGGPNDEAVFVEPADEKGEEKDEEGNGEGAHGKGYFPLEEGF
jgi:hypothetical protein